METVNKFCRTGWRMTFNFPLAPEEDPASVQSVTAVMALA